MAYIYHVYTIPETYHYIGQETVLGKRWKDEVRAALNGSKKQPRLFNWIKKYFTWTDSAKCRFIVDRIPVADEEKDATEIFWIAFARLWFGEEKVVNQSDGGEGWTFGKKNQKLKEYWSDPEVKKQRSEIMKNLGDKIGEKIKDDWANPEQKKRRQDSMKKVSSNPEIKRRRREGLKKIASSPEYRKIRSETMKRVWAERKRKIVV